MICNQVLEQVLDDRRAMSELMGVLKPGGLALMQHLVDQTLERTFEDPGTTSPRERRRLSGQRASISRHGLADEPIWICRLSTADGKLVRPGSRGVRPRRLACDPRRAVARSLAKERTACG